jgi:hypothetical protein
MAGDIPPLTVPQSNVPATGTFLLPVCTDADTLPYILAALEYYGRLNMGGAGAARRDILEAMAFVDNPGAAACAAGIGGGMRLRQSPEDECILQQEQTPGNWVDVFDYALCDKTSPGDIVTIEQTLIDARAALNILIDLYDGTPESIDVDIEYGQGNDDNLDRALCAALKLLVDAVCDTELERRRRDLKTAQVAGAALTVVALVSGLFTAGGSWLAYGMAIGGSATTFGGLLGELLPDALEDAEARADVVCCLYDELKGSTPTRPSWLAAYDHCAEALTGNAGELATMLLNMSVDAALYIAFINHMAKVSKSPEIQTYLCPCDEGDEWCVDYVFNTSSYNWQAVPGRGVYNGGWFAEPSPAPNRLRVYAETLTPTHIRRVDMSYFLGGPLAVGNILWSIGGHLGFSVRSNELWKGPTGTHQNTFVYDPPILADTLRVAIEMSGDFGPRHELLTVRIRGFGVPFQKPGDECP